MTLHFIAEDLGYDPDAAPMYGAAPTRHDWLAYADDEIEAAAQQRLEAEARMDDLDQR